MTLARHNCHGCVAMKTHCITEKICLPYLSALSANLRHSNLSGEVKTSLMKRSFVFVLIKSEMTILDLGQRQSADNPMLVKRPAGSLRRQDISSHDIDNVEWVGPCVT